MSGAQTPMMQQYQKIKAAHAGFLLFYRMGDFYELFGADAEAASSVLGITLTARRTSKDEAGIPMCGVPHHAAEGYIATLIEAGYKVALCDQTETPEEAKARGGYKALVQRDVVRLFTGGTLTEDGLLRAGAHNYLAAVYILPQRSVEAKSAEHSENNAQDVGVAWLDISTGEVAVQTVQLADLGGELLRLSAAEVLATEADSRALEAFWPLSKTTINDALFTPTGAAEDIQTAYGITSLTALGLADDAQTMALGALLGYVRLTQVGKLPQLQRPSVVRTSSHVQLDAATRRNLEITQTQRGKRAGSLLHAVDQTVTPAGARLLSVWLSAPLTDVDKINARLTAVQFMLDNMAVREDVRSTLKATADMARAVSRLSLGRGGPRDLVAVRDTLQVLPQLISTIENGKGRGGALSSVLAKLAGLEDVAKLLASALKTDDVPLLARDGNFVAAGYSTELEKYRTLMRDGNQLLQNLLAEETAQTGLQLKLKYNKVWGRFFEVSRSQTQQNDTPTHFIHRQTTTNAQRFTTEKLMLLEQDLAAAEANASAEELSIFNDLTATITTAAPRILAAADALARIDVLAAGATLAARQNYTRPTIKTASTFVIEGGRHPVVAPALAAGGANFMPNSTNLSNHQLWLITGPNMAGKSTFLRQNALITILAQVGYFVPATRAEVGIVDKIFCRLGASDDLAEGQSTFMVEMVETAHILAHATPQSLVILDEIGRGTATYDGLSIAWACVEHLVSVCKARGLFATHYHELTALADTFAPVSNYHMAVKEWRGDVVFLHEVRSGAAPGSYGIHVAKLAGVPASVLKRAQELLANLEAAGGAGAAVQAAEMPLFANNADMERLGALESADVANMEDLVARAPSAVEQKLVTLNLDDLSPREAQNLLYDLKIMAAMGGLSADGALRSVQERDAKKVKTDALAADVAVGDGHNA